MRESKKPIYTLDTETDPFLYGRAPKPFCFGLYDGQNFRSTWGDNCEDEMRDIVSSLEPGIIYIHNGGKFDLYFILHWLAHERRMTIINRRIVKADMLVGLWRFGEQQAHQIRDSYALMPFALEKYKKDDIDYKLFEREIRNKHKRKILKYLHGDCRYLWDLCVGFHERFGDHLTIGGTAMSELKKLHDFECLTDQQDFDIRDKYYYGGRVQCFEHGNLTTKEQFQVLDLNQSYPNAMLNFMHPIGMPSYSGNEITKDTYFAMVRGRNYGAFPTREKTGIKFTLERGNFYVTIHELNAAIELGLFELEDVIETEDFYNVGNFDTFVLKFTGMRRDSQESGDEQGSLFYKYVGNSAYGKFSQSPENYFDYMMTAANVDISEMGFERCQLDVDAGEQDYVMWRTHTDNASRYNVATGASITGAARAVLMRGIASSKRPVYCDTDCVVCEDMQGVEIHDTKLGAWKCEKTGDKMSIAGKKLYALFNKGKVVKLASKGVKLTGEQIRDVASGKEIDYYKDAPTYDLYTGKPRFIKRTVRMTY